MSVVVLWAVIRESEDPLRSRLTAIGGLRCLVPDSSIVGLNPSRVLDRLIRGIPPDSGIQVWRADHHDGCDQARADCMALCKCAIVRVFP